MTRYEAIIRDVPALQAERLRLIAFADNATPQVIAILQRRIDKIEERFSEVGLNAEGQ